MVSIRVSLKAWAKRITYFEKVEEHIRGELKGYQAELRS